MLELYCLVLLLNITFSTMPGIPVVICQGDEVVVEVHNKLHMESTTIHFHGKYINNIMNFNNIFDIFLAFNKCY